MSVALTGHLQRAPVVPLVQASDPVVAIDIAAALIEGGLVRVGGQMAAGIHAGPAAGVVYACVAETMLWALEKAFDHVRPDSAMTLQTMDALEAYGQRHGFEIVR